MPSSADRPVSRRSSAAAALLLAATGLGAAAVPALAATPPVATITSPTAGQPVGGDAVRVAGRYTDDSAVSQVRLVACRVEADGACTRYVQRDGSLSTTWVAHQAQLSAPRGTSGTYTYAFPALAAGAYQVSSFAVGTDGVTGPKVRQSVTVGAAPADAGYYSIVWARSRWAQTGSPGCTPLAGARTLRQNADDLAARGLTGVMSVVIDRTEETAHDCHEGYASYASWQDLATLRDTYGWHAISHGQAYADTTKMTTDQQRYAETCGSLDELTAHGHRDAWGLFNFPNNAQDAAAQAVVGTCFAWGRWYSDQRNTRAKATSAPYSLKVLSVNGGQCNNPALPCYTMPTQNNRRMTDPAVISGLLRPGAGQYGVVQLYTLLEGRSARWDCTSPDWRDHWTTIEESYCRDDAMLAIDGRSRDAVNTHPAAVAEAWGRTPASRLTADNARAVAAFRR